jgi:predicted acetyltransferase
MADRHPKASENDDMTWNVRPLVAGDAEQSRQLGFEAFGMPVVPPSQPAAIDQPGCCGFGAFDGQTLVARMIDREYDSYFGGVAVPTAGIAGVTVAVEHRGQGTLDPLFAATLAGAKARGAVISTLFPTAARIYRKFGYEVITDFVSVQVPTLALSQVATPTNARTRRAVATDFDDIGRIYDSWAAAQNGPLTRHGVSFTATAEEFLDDFDGVTVAIDGAGLLVGYVSWNRGQGYGDSAITTVSDLLAVTADAHRALLRAIGSNASVTPRTKIDSSVRDITRLFLPWLDWKVVDASPYMLKILDVVGALSPRLYPPSMRVELSFQLVADFLTENIGSYALAVADGRAVCRRLDGEAAAGQKPATFTPQGLALLYAGAQSAANLRFAGHLSGGSLDHDRDWDALFGGALPEVRDYF